MNLIVYILIAGAILTIVTAYSSKRFYNLNGHIYTETLEQPWFRYPHEAHLPIPVELAINASFGKHRLPPDDVFVEHDWTDEENKYLPCLTLACVCPYYGGKISGTKCILSNKKLLQRAIRKEARMLNGSERFQLAVAFNKMKESGMYDRFGLVHKYSGLHEGPGFFTWHREFLKRFELAFRRFLPPGSQLGLPYWDSSLESELPDPRESIFFSKLFVGSSNSTGEIVDGPFVDWNIMEGTRKVRRFVPDMNNGEVLNNARIDIVLERKKIEEVLAAAVPLEVTMLGFTGNDHSTYETDEKTCKIFLRDDRLLSYSHDYVHYFINGDMKETYSSASEPIFYYHHTMIDHIWEMWRQLRQTRKQRESDYPPPLGDCYSEAHFANASLKELQPYTNLDALSNNYTDNMYVYEERPTCSIMKQDCGSQFLFCYPVNGIFQCLAKLRPGANCEAFEHTPVCYHGQCLQGRCVKNDDKIPYEDPFM